MCMAQKNIDDLVLKVQRNMFRLLFAFNSKSIFTKIGGNTYIGTRHGLPKELAAAAIMTDSSLPIQPRDHIYCEPSMAIDIGADAVMIEMGKYRSPRIDYFTTDFLPGKSLLILPSKVVNVVSYIVDFQPPTCDKVEKMYCYDTVEAVRGNSGALLVSLENNGFSIVGMHIAGDEMMGRGWACPFRSIPIANGMAMMDTFLVGGLPPEIVELREKSILNHYDHICSGQVLGSLANGHTMRPYSTLVETPAKEFYQCKLEVPKLGNRVEDNVFICPDFRRMYHMLMARPAIRPDIVFLAQEAMFIQLARILPADLKRDSIPNVLNGMGNGIKPLKTSTSAGYGLSGKKEDHLFSDKERKYPRSHIMRDVYEKIIMYDNNYFVPAWTAPSQKDEPVKAEKNSKGDIRLFYPTQYVDNILMACYFGPLFRSMIDYRFEIPGCEGVNAADPREWACVANKLKGEGIDFTKILDLDGAFWDLLQSFSVYAMEVAIRLLMRCPDYVNVYNILLGIMNTELHSILVIMGWDLVLLFNRMLSGKFGTTVWNIFSMQFAWNVVMIISCFSLEVEKRMLFSVKQQVLNVILEETLRDLYGDDNGSTFSYVIHQYIKDPIVFVKIFLWIGVEMQSGDKQSAIKYTTIDNFKFLKRGFRYDNGFCYAPLDENSIYKMISFYDTRGGVSYTEFLNTNLPLMQACWFMHGRERFDFETKRMVSLVEILQHVPESSAVEFTPKTWDDYQLLYVQGQHVEWGL